MLVDIVPLPRRLNQFARRSASIDSSQIIGLPISLLNRVYGYWEPDDSSCMGVGGKHVVITGKDALFRYKFIEPTKSGIVEYFVLTASPLDVLSPNRTQNVRLYCPCVTLTDTKADTFSMITRRFILWNGVFDLIHFEVEDNVNDVPAEAVIVNEIRNLGRMFGRSDLTELVKEHPDYKNVLISEVKPEDNTLEQLMTLWSNVNAYNEMAAVADPCHLCDITDVLRGINVPVQLTDIAVLRNSLVLQHFLYGSCTFADLKHLVGMNYSTHSFYRWFNTEKLDDFIELSIYSDDYPDLFDILKYIESLPYSEFSIAVNKDGLCDVMLYNQYDCSMLPRECKPEFKQAVSEKLLPIVRKMKDVESISLVRSWSEEVYITIKKDSGSSKKFYFDLLSASIGSRSLIRDYDGHLFS